ncbi:alkaline shock response membrane anchor protein AmaP [Sinobaca sp. H24]|uniref:alkaline shock response membrane anchor protein AmaP n=1 Tax=Sinobaca sp. H24 TaxID=2923376 RepID=UPI00207AAAC9|nr:alkaline shock response membrane anchor protein AmaP [Sinobaca sp. H24]
MSFFLRLLLIILAIVNMAAAVLTIGAIFGLASGQWITSFVVDADFSSTPGTIALITAVAWLLFSIIALIAAVKFKKKRSGERIDMTMPTGKISVSMKTFKKIAYHNAIAEPGVLDVKMTGYHSPTDEAVYMKLDIMVDGQVPLQTLSRNVQQSVKESIEKLTEVRVSDINISISDQISTGPMEEARVQ